MKTTLNKTDEPITRPKNEDDLTTDTRYKKQRRQIKTENKLGWSRATLEITFGPLKLENK